MDNAPIRWNLLPYALLLLSLTLPATSNADPSLTPYSAEYLVKISVLSGRLTTDLRAAGDGFVATHIIRPTGLARLVSDGSITETSRFGTTEGNVKATWYRSEDSLSKDKTSAQVTFDWYSNEMSGTVNDEAVQILLDGLVHDRVAIQYQLMQDLLNGVTEDSYVLFDIDEFKTLIVSSIGEREIKTPAGIFNAVGIQHRTEHSDRVTTLWCVAKLGYLPALIEQHRNGKLRLRASLKNHSPLAD